jgi:ParB-like chromosome segregation protein Spo0J
MAWDPLPADDIAEPFAAPDAPIPGLVAEKADEVILVRVDQVEAGERLRDIDPIWSEALGNIMQRDGQRDPIDICRLPGRTNWTLAGAGGHRLDGARRVGMEFIKAIVGTADLADRQMREVADNLQRRDLDPIDRAAFVARLVDLHKRRAGIDPAKDGRAASVAARWQRAVKEEAADTNATIAVVYGWAEGVAEQVGLSRRTIENDLALYRRLAPSQIARLREARHPVATNASQLRALIKLEHAEQEKAVNLLLLADNIKTVGDAVAKMRGSNRAIDPEAKRLSTFIGTFARMGLAEKKGALLQLAGQLPAGMKLVEAGSEPAPEERYRVELIDALGAAFEVLGHLADGDVPVEDDDIHAARSRVQLSLMAVNAGAIPAPQGEA